MGRLFAEGRIGFETLVSEREKCGDSTRALVASLNDQLFDLSCQFVREAWSRASTDGTAMHEALEFFFDPAHPESLVVLGNDAAMNRQSNVFCDGEIERASSKKLIPGWSGTYEKSAIRIHLLWLHARPAPATTPKRAISAQCAGLR